MVIKSALLTGVSNGSLKTRTVSSGKRPEITHAGCCTLVFDTDAKNLYVEREVAHLDMTVEGAIEIQTATMDIADYLKQGGQTAGHRELWRLLKKIFKEDRNSDELVETGAIRLSCLARPI
jgi:hypothetical protein